MNNTSPIFEMILENPVGAPALVSARPSVVEQERDWQVDHQEGQLSVDVSETTKDLVIISPMAGAETNKIEVYIHNDLLTIRGYRPVPTVNNEITNRFYTECFWGSFSRTVVLPIDIKADLAQAEYNNGVLIVRVPKQRLQAKIPVMIVEE